MKYEKLYGMLAKTNVTFRLGDYPANIVVPTHGYAVFAQNEPWIILVAGDKEGFDTAIDKARSQLPAEFLQLALVDSTHTIFIDPVSVFVSRGDAAKHAAKTHQDSIYDLAEDEAIYIKQKRKEGK